MTKVNWNNKDEVIAAAKQYGPGMTVIKRLGRANYNIIHTSREADRLLGAKVIHRT